MNLATGRQGAIAAPALYIVHMLGSYRHARGLPGLPLRILGGIPHLEIGPASVLVAGEAARDTLLAFNAPDDGFMVTARRADSVDATLLRTGSVDLHAATDFVRQLAPSASPAPGANKEAALANLVALLS